MDLPLSTDVLEGLQLVADNTHIPDSSFADFVVGVCESLYNDSKRDAVIGRYHTIAQSGYASCASHCRSVTTTPTPLQATRPAYNFTNITFKDPNSAPICANRKRSGRVLLRRAHHMDLATWNEQ